MKNLKTSIKKSDKYYFSRFQLGQAISSLVGVVLATAVAILIVYTYINWDYVSTNEKLAAALLNSAGCLSIFTILCTISWIVTMILSLLKARKVDITKKKFLYISNISSAGVFFLLGIAVSIMLGLWGLGFVSNLDARIRLVIAIIVLECFRIILAILTTINTFLYWHKYKN